MTITFYPENLSWNGYYPSMPRRNTLGGRAFIWAEPALVGAQFHWAIATIDRAEDLRSYAGRCGFPVGAQFHWAIAAIDRAENLRSYAGRCGFPVGAQFHWAIAWGAEQVQSRSSEPV